MDLAVSNFGFRHHASLAFGLAWKNLVVTPLLLYHYDTPALGVTSMYFTGGGACKMDWGHLIVVSYMWLRDGRPGLS